jgi:glycosyltransferase involved in cell wall biosynthesis
VHFFIAGHGELEAHLKAQAREMGLESSVHFLGLRHDVPALLGAADVFCYTSRYEGFPNALLEAMAAGRPIITTWFDGVEDLVEPDRTARVVGQDDDAAAFAALAALLSDSAGAASLGRAARRAAESRFDMTHMVEATLDYYGRIMGAVT